MDGGSRTVIFWLQIAYLLGLFSIGYVYLIVPGHLGIPDSLGLIPVGVPWFGALGAVLISLTGVFQHAHDWDESYMFWHWSRPVVGAAIAVVAVLMLQAGILSVSGSTQPQPPSSAASSTGTPSSTPPLGTSTAAPAATPTMPSLPASSQPQQTRQQPILFYVIAFLVAYREETFRELIKRAADVILTPATPPVPPSATAMAPQEGPLGGGTQATITGNGLMGTRAVMFGTTSAFFRIESDTQVTVTSPPGPAGPPPVRVPVVVSGKGGNSTAGQFTYT